LTGKDAKRGLPVPFITLENLMGSISPALLIFGCALALLVILVSQAMRRLAVVVVVLGGLWAASNVFIRTRACPLNGVECMMPLQPVAAGPCSASERSAVLKIDGHYYLAAQPGIAAEASCIDLRFWQ
jgi:hypothetical protein